MIPTFFWLDNQISSVQRQLNLYGFKCISRGEDKGAFYHPKFRRGDWEVVKKINRYQPKKSDEKIEDPTKPTPLSGDDQQSAQRPNVNTVNTGIIRAGPIVLGSVTASSNYPSSDPNRQPSSWNPHHLAAPGAAPGPASHYHQNFANPFLHTRPSYDPFGFNPDSSFAYNAPMNTGNMDGQSNTSASQIPHPMFAGPHQPLPWHWAGAPLAPHYANAYLNHMKPIMESEFRSNNNATNNNNNNATNNNNNNSGNNNTTQTANIKPFAQQSSTTSINTLSDLFSVTKTAPAPVKEPTPLPSAKSTNSMTANSSPRSPAMKSTRTNNNNDGASSPLKQSTDVQGYINVVNDALFIDPEFDLDEEFNNFFNEEEQIIKEQSLQQQQQANGINKPTAVTQQSSREIGVNTDITQASFLPFY